MRVPLALLGALLLAPVASAAAEQVHLGLPTADASTSRSVLWLDLAPPRDDATLTLAWPGGRTIVPAQHVDGPSLGSAYEAKLVDLDAGMAYAYTVEGRTFGFVTPPTSGGNEPLRIVALGDMGTNERSRATVAAIEDLDPDLVLHMGDISYAEGNPVLWKAWFDMVEPVAARIPWMTALGNHETYTGSGVMGLTGFPSPAEIAFYQQRFGLPGNELWYSFDWGGVHVVALDTFSQPSIAAAQIEWLEADLAANADAAWTIVFLHEPPYSSNDHGSSERVQDAFVQLFEDHGVDLVLAGHDHGYERSHPLDGVVYVVSGGGGESLYSTWETPAPAWSAARGAEYHVTLLEITPDRIVGRPVTTQGGRLDDAFTLERAAGDDGTAPAGVVERGAPGLAPLALVAVAALAARLRR